MLGTSAIALPLGSLALTGLSLLFKSDPRELGFGVGSNLLSHVLASAPDWLRDRFPRRVGEPNHDLARAFHGCLNDTLLYASEGRPLKRFQEDCPHAWNSLHQGLRDGIKKWFSDLASAAGDRSTAGTSPLIPLNDAFLMALLKDNGDTALSRLHALVQTDLQRRLSVQATSSDSQSTLDDEALQSLNEFVAWLCGHLDAQVQLFFLEQMKPTEKGPSPAWISYQFLLGQAMEQHLGEIAAHAVDTRKAVEEIIRLLKTSSGSPALADWPQKAISHLEKRITGEIKKLGISLESLRAEMHGGFDQMHGRFDQIRELVIQLRADFSQRGIDPTALTREEMERELSAYASGLTLAEYRRLADYARLQTEIWRDQMPVLRDLFSALKGAGMDVGEFSIPVIDVGVEFSGALSSASRLLPKATSASPTISLPTPRRRLLEWDEVLQLVRNRVALVWTDGNCTGAAWWIDRHHYWAPESLWPLVEQAKKVHLQWLSQSKESWPVQRPRHDAKMRAVVLSLHSTTSPPVAPPIPEPSLIGLGMASEIGMVVLRAGEPAIASMVLDGAAPKGNASSEHWQMKHLNNNEPFDWLPGLPLFTQDATLLGFVSHYAPPVLTVLLPSVIS